MNTLTFTERAFVRSHGRRPSASTHGLWGFQLTAGMDAFNWTLTGDIFWTTNTLSEAKKAAKAHFAGLGWCVAILP